MTNQQHYKLHQATLVRTMATAHFPTAACTRTARRPHSKTPRVPYVTSLAKSESCLRTLHLLQA